MVQLKNLSFSTSILDPYKEWGLASVINLMEYGHLEESQVGAA